MGAKCPFAHGEHERRLALAAMHQLDSPAGASMDRTSLKHAAPSTDSVETAVRQHSASSSLPGTPVGLMSVRLGSVVLTHFPHHDATCCMMVVLNLIQAWPAHLGQAWANFWSSCLTGLVVDSQSKALYGHRVGQRKGVVSAQAVMPDVAALDVSKGPWRIFIEEQLMAAVCSAA